MTVSETTASIIQTPRAAFRLKLPDWLTNNPIILKEMQSRMRGWRSLLGLTGFIALLSSIVALLYFMMVSVGNSIQIDFQRILGRTIFFSVYGIELIMICMIAPGMTAGAISAEKEQQTFDLLRTTLLTARDLVLGKLLAALSYVLLFMIAAIPLQAIAFIFGGLTLGEVVISVLIMCFSAILFGSVGIFYSSFITKTRVSTGAAQLTTMAVVIILPILVLVGMIALENRYSITQMSDLGQILFFGTIWLIGISSPAATAIATEYILTEEHALFFFSGTLNSGATVYIPSPWLGFIVLSPLLTLLLLYFSIRFVKRAES